MFVIGVGDILSFGLPTEVTVFLAGGVFWRLIFSEQSPALLPLAYPRFF